MYPLLLSELCCVVLCFSFLAVRACGLVWAWVWGWGLATVVNHPLYLGSLSLPARCQHILVAGVVDYELLVCVLNEVSGGGRGVVMGGGGGGL